MVFGTSYTVVAVWKVFCGCYRSLSCYCSFLFVDALYLMVLGHHIHRCFEAFIALSFLVMLCKIWYWDIVHSSCSMEGILRLLLLFSFLLMPYNLWYWNIVHNSCSMEGVLMLLSLFLFC